MFPLIRFVAVFGGVAAGAQVASHCVRAVRELCHGRPVTALVEFADGLAAPILTACNEVSKCGKEIYDAVTSPWENGQPQEQAPLRQEKPCCPLEHAQEGSSLNGMQAVVAKG